MSDLQISEFMEADWKTYKKLRLQSLKDSPDSFGSTYEREIEFSEQDRKSRLVAKIEHANILPLIAVSNGTPVGLAIGIVHGQESETANIYQMWVSKQNRGKGIGSALLKKIILWANDLNLKSISLDVIISNAEAVSLYRSAGFVSSGNPKPLKEGSALFVQPMILELKSRNA